MSVGGKVVQVYEMRDRRTEEGKTFWINTLDDGDYCSVIVFKENHHGDICLGDIIWWHGDCYWTPQGSDKEITLKKIGGSGVSHPLGKEYEVEYDFYPAFSRQKKKVKELEETISILRGHSGVVY